MGQIATSNQQITLYCIENSNMAKQTLAYAKAECLSVLIVDISKTPITGTQILEMAKGLGMEINDLIDPDNHLFKSKNELPNLSPEDWITMIQQYPEILKQPIAIRGNHTILIATPTDIIKL